jgi:hypothetical protein
LAKIAVYFTVDVESHLITENEPCRQVVVFNPGWDLSAEFVLFGQILWFQSLEHLKFL